MQKETEIAIKAVMHSNIRTFKNGNVFIQSEYGILIYTKEQFELLKDIGTLILNYEELKPYQI